MDSVLSILSTIGVIIAVILFFNLMIFVHELGHFIAGRWRGLYIDRFQIWFGKPLWKKKINGVQWGLGWIPAGGFVSLPQMAPMEAIEGEVELPEDLKPVTPLDKIIVAAAGPLASLSLAFFFACIVWITGYPENVMKGTTVGYVEPNSPAAEAGLLPGDKILAVDGQPVEYWIDNDMGGIRQLIALSENEKVAFTIEREGEPEPITIMSGYRIPETSWWQRSAMRQIGFSYSDPCLVESVLPGSPAEKAGLKKGDRLISLNGEKLWGSTQFFMAENEGKPMSLEVERENGEKADLALVPAMPANWQGKEGAKPTTGLSFSAEGMLIQTIQHPTPIAQVGQSLRWMKDTIMKVVAPNSSVGMQHLSGPVGIGNHIYRLLVVENGILLALWFAVVLNVNLAVLNMLPLPVVDGGHVVMNTLELIFRRPISARFLEIIQTGFVFVILGFFLFVTFKDVGDFMPDGKSKLPAPSFEAK